MLQRIEPMRVLEGEPHQRGDQVRKRHQIEQNAEKVSELRRGVGSSVDGLVRQNQTLHGIDQAVAGLRHQDAEHQQSCHGEEDGKIVCFGDSGDGQSKSHEAHDHGVQNRNDFQSGLIAAQLTQHLAALTERAEQVHQQPEGLGSDPQAQQ